MFASVLDFWFEAGEEKWFAGDERFDAEIRARFGALHKSALEGKKDGWKEKAPSALALVIVLDQFSRNIYRGDARAFSADAKALASARDAIARGFDLEMPVQTRGWFYMPFLHAEDMKAQEESLIFFEERLENSRHLDFARSHAETIRRFGRFPARNRALKRANTPEEEAYLLEKSQQTQPITEKEGA